MEYRVKQILVSGEAVSIGEFGSQDFALKYMDELANEYKGIEFAVYEFNRGGMTDLRVAGTYVGIEPSLYADTDSIRTTSDVLERVAIDTLKACIHAVEEHGIPEAAQWLEEQNLSVASAKEIIKLHIGSTYGRFVKTPELSTEEMSNEIAEIVVKASKKTYVNSFVTNDFRYEIADAILEAGYRK